VFPSAFILSLTVFFFSGRYKKNLEPTPAGADRTDLTILKVGSTEHYVQSTSSKLQAMCGNWNLLGLTMPSLSEL
jgi:hypothetical protein